MSKSYQKQAKKHRFQACFLSWAGNTNKSSKKMANRIFRSKNRMKMREVDEDTTFYNMREVSDVWDFATDGLAHFFNMRKRWNHSDNKKQEDLKMDEVYKLVKK